MAEYEKNIFFGLISNGMLKEAIEYLSKFPQCERLYRKYKRVFENEKYYSNKYLNKKHTKDETKKEDIKELLEIYAKYYHQTFYKKIDESEEILRKNLENYLLKKKKNVDNLSIDELEKILEETIDKEKYIFIPGKVNGYYGPYIFKIFSSKDYKIDLINENITLRIYFISDFLSKGWIDYLSFGKLKLNYMLGEENNIFISLAFLKNNPQNIEKPKYKSTLYYLAEYITTIKRYKFIDVKDVEYRSKLVEIIKYKSILKFKEVLNLASKNEYNELKYACFVIVNKLSLIILNKEFESDYEAWKGKGKQIKEGAKKLYNEHTNKINNTKYGYINP